MGFWQHLVTSYEKNADILQKEYPLSSTTISNNSDNILVVVIDGDGKFLDCNTIRKRPTGKNRKDTPLVRLSIPVTEGSMGRSSGVCPHPVFDQFDFLKGDGEKFEAYKKQLKEFAESEFATDQVRAISKYINARTLGTDIAEMKPQKKTNIVFQVEIDGDLKTKAWENDSFFEAWHRFYLSKKREAVEKKKEAEKRLSDKKVQKEEKKILQERIKSNELMILDYIKGEGDQLAAISHPKKISNGAANSKLISDNDNTNFTFRGKFVESSDAVSIGYESSQKAHQFLRYLIKDRGYSCGEQTIFSYTIGSIKSELPPPIEEKSMWDVMQTLSINTEKDEEIQLRAETGFDFADSMRKLLAGYKGDFAKKEHDRTAIIALDASTNGRMSIKFYRELERGEYLEKIADWHYYCKWHQQIWNKEKKEYNRFIGAPTVDRIIEAVYGKPRSGNDETYIKIKKAARERLLRCIFDGTFIPIDFVTAAVRRASKPLSIIKNDKYEFEQIISTTCALLRKHFQETKKEVYKLSIEIDRIDRDYLYGRLLGAADKLEEYALYKKNNKRVVTAAIRYMQTFAQHPFRTWQTIHASLIPYIQEKRGFAFDEIQAIMNKFESGQYEEDVPLNGSYLIGYYHERVYIDSLVNSLGSKLKSINNYSQEDIEDDK
ncbi:MAG: type I-C CRISPR-associated protein Cas8c/Csd1 [Desulfamplus sp.]|nr:type I-C CRISPR-associated protein Cas8c/Csd1 [Desulfamplus sp.]